MDHFRQGDVLILRTDEPLPKAARPVPRDAGRVVLAYGELTGHAHAITEPAATLYALTDAEVDDRFLQIIANQTGGGGAALQHEEHDTITLPPGTYRVRRQREYAPEAPRMILE